jgi:peroxiredoxin Q/BCP
MTRGLLAIALPAVLLVSSALAVDLKSGDPAPRFTAKTHEGREFRLEDRKGQWTVLYFYPKAGTPGCTRQACAFRDGIAAIRAEGADVFGISTDTVESQAEFHEDEHLSFTLLADPRRRRDQRLRGEDADPHDVQALDVHHRPDAHHPPGPARR